MAAQITTYGGLKAGMLAWMARTGDTVLDGRFDDFLLNCERRIYYGYATDDPGNALRSDPLRVPEMQTVDSAFSLSSGTVAQPTLFLELISAYNTTLSGPLEIVAERVIDGYGTQSIGGTRLIAVSGTNFRVFDAPTTANVAVLRYYQKLTPPAASAVNAILTNYPDVYLYGCLLEASIFTQDEAGGMRYLQLYNASVQGLNARTQRVTASANPVMRLRGATP